MLQELTEENAVEEMQLQAGLADPEPELNKLLSQPEVTYYEGQTKENQAN